MQALYHSSEANSRMLRFHLLEATRKLQETDLIHSHFQQQFQQVMEQLTEEETRYKQYATELHEEKAQGDIRSLCRKMTLTLYIN